MKKEQYKQVMKQIQMPESCEQAILEKIGKPIEIKRRHTWKRHTVAAVAVAACIVVTGVVSVSAVHYNDWVQFLFPGQEESVVMDAAAQNVGNVSAFTADLENLDAELLSAFADESTLYFALRVTPIVENSELYDEGFGLFDADPVELAEAEYSEETGTWTYFMDEPFLVDGLGLVNDGITRSGNMQCVPDGEGGYLYIAKYHLENWKFHTGSEVRINLAPHHVEKDADGNEIPGTYVQYDKIGTLNFTLDLEQSQDGVVYDVSALWDNDKGYFQAQQITVAPLSIMLDGVADSQNNRPTTFTAILQDGSTVSAEPQSWGYKTGGTVTETTADVQFNLLLEQPVNPEDVTAVQLDDVVIPLQ